MATSTLLDGFVHLTRTGATVLREQARYHASDQVARLTGRTADLVGQAGDSAGELAETATARLLRLTGVATETASRQVERFSDRIADEVRSRSAELGDGVVRMGEKFEER